MLNSLFLKNFRGFKGWHEIPLGKLTFLYGQNSSGKSSVLSGLQLSANGEGNWSPLYCLPFARGGYAKGTFQTNIHGQNVARSLGVGHRINIPHMLLPNDPGYELIIKREYVNIPADHPEIQNENHNFLDSMKFEIPGASKHLRFGLEQGFGGDPPVPPVETFDLVLNCEWDYAVESFCKEYPKPEGGRIGFMHLADVDEFMEVLRHWVRYEEKMHLLASDHGGDFVKEDEDVRGYLNRLWASWEYDPYRWVFEEWKRANPNESNEKGQGLAMISAKPKLKALARPEIKAILKKITWWVSSHYEGADIKGQPLGIFLHPGDVLGEAPCKDPEIILGLECVSGYIWHIIQRGLDQLQLPSVLGPMRQEPRRYFFESEAPDVSVQDIFSNFPYTSHSKVQVTLVNDWLEKWNIPLELEIHQEKTRYAGNIITPLFKHKHTGLKHTFAEVGYGLSQLVPMLAADALQAEMALRRLVYVEQPEIHLHPRLQANLVDFFIDRVQVQLPPGREIKSIGVMVRSSFGAKSQGQWIIETHSEAMMLRLQRRIREGKISPSDVKVIHIGYLKGEGSVVTELRLDEEGNFLDEWPDGFFEDSFDDLFDLGLS